MAEQDNVTERTELKKRCEQVELENDNLKAAIATLNSMFVNLICNLRKN